MTSKRTHKRLVRAYSWSIDTYNQLNSWRKLMGVEPTRDTKKCRTPVLKTGPYTGRV
jgi:hypothetical protein